MSDNTIDLVKDYSAYPGGRNREHSDHSGEEFREDLLRPALESGKRTLVILDGAFTIPPSFLDEAFGSLIEEFGVQKVEEAFEIELSDDPDAKAALEDIFLKRTRKN